MKVRVAGIILAVVLFGSCETIDLTDAIASGVVGALGRQEEPSSEDGSANQDAESEDANQNQAEENASNTATGRDPSQEMAEDDVEPAQPLPEATPTADWSLVAEVELGGPAGAVQVVGQYAYQTVGNITEIIDVSNPSNPRLAATTPIVGTIMGDYLFDTTNVYSLANPLEPRLVGPLEQTPLAIADGKMVVRTDDGIGVVAGTNPADLGRVHPIPTVAFALFDMEDGRVVDALIDGDIVYLLYETGVQVVNVSTVSAPRSLEAVQAAVNVPAGRGPGMESLELHDGRVFAVTRYPEDALRVFDVSDPARPAEVEFFQSDGKGFLDGTLETPVPTTGLIGMSLEIVNGTPVVATAGGLVIPTFSGDALVDQALVSESWRNRPHVARRGSFLLVSESAAGLSVYDVSNPVRVRRVGSRPTKGQVFDAIERDGLLFVHRSRGLEVVDVSSPTNPRSVAELDLRAQGNSYQYTLDSSGDWLTLAGLLIDISDPTVPRFVATTPLVGASDREGWSGSTSVNSDGEIAATRYNRETRELELHVFSADGSPTMRGTQMTTIPESVRSGLGFLADGRLLLNIDGTTLIEFELDGTAALELSRVTIPAAAFGQERVSGLVVGDSFASTGHPLLGWDYSQSGNPREILRFATEYGPAEVIDEGFGVLGEVAVSLAAGQIEISYAPEYPAGEIIAIAVGAEHVYYLTSEGSLDVWRR